MLLLLLLAKGWAVTRLELTYKPLVFGVWLGYGIVHILLYVWNTVSTFLYVSFYKVEHALCLANEHDDVNKNLTFDNSKKDRDSLNGGLYTKHKCMECRS